MNTEAVEASRPEEDEMARSKKKKKQQLDAQAMVERATELREHARELAGEGSEAFKGFSSTTSAAAKDFAKTTFEAAKDLLETVEKANARLVKQTQKKKRRRGRKVLTAGLALGAGAAIVANEKSRELIAAQVRRLRGEPPPEPWETTTGDGGMVQEPTHEPTTP